MQEVRGSSPRATTVILGICVVAFCGRERRCAAEGSSAGGDGARQPTFPTMSSLSSTPICSTYAAPTAIRNAGDPIQYDHLRIEHDQGAVEVAVCNRAILPSTTDSEAVRRPDPLAMRPRLG